VANNLENAPKKWLICRRRHWRRRRNRRNLRRRRRRRRRHYRFLKHTRPWSNVQMTVAVFLEDWKKINGVKKAFDIFFTL
jgi:hypothetical protein